MMGVFQTMKAISVVPLLLLLSGCGPSRESEADLADCHKAAIKTYSGGDGGDPAMSDFQKSCMASKGYRFSAIAYNCGRGDLYGDAACYAR